MVQTVQSSSSVSEQEAKQMFDVAPSPQQTDETAPKVDEAKQREQQQEYLNQVRAAQERGPV